MFLLVVACTLMLFMEGSGWPDPDCGQSLVHSRGRFIYDGQRAKEGEFPWMVYLDIVTVEGYVSNCGGSIIKRDVVLTAAHCLREGFNTTASNIYAGSTDVSEVALYLQRRKFKQFIIHEDYWGGGVMPDHNHDLALIKLTRPFDFETSKGRIGTVCLSEMSPRPGKVVTVAGWGFTSPYGPLSDHLLAITVPVLKNKTCMNIFSSWYRPKSMFCAGENSKQAGEGDSGGPALVTTAGKSLQVGIASFHHPLKQYSSVAFTKVSTYREWIADTLKKLK